MIISTNETVQDALVNDNPFYLDNTLSLFVALVGKWYSDTKAKDDIIFDNSKPIAFQKDLIEIDQLQKELQDAKYKALSSSSQITEKSRESNVLEMLKNNKDSVLHIATQPPYIINVPEQ